MEWNWLQVAAAFGTLVSLATLTLTVFFRIWDSRTRISIAFWVDEKGPLTPLVFRVLNRSKTAVLIENAYLEYGDGEGQQQEFGRRWSYEGAVQIQPNFPLVMEEPLSVIAEILVRAGHKGTCETKFVVLDGTGKRHEKPIVLRGLEEWSKGDIGPHPIEPPRAPWYQRWFRKIAGLAAALFLIP